MVCSCRAPGPAWLAVLTFNLVCVCRSGVCIECDSVAVGWVLLLIVISFIYVLFLFFLSRSSAGKSKILYAFTQLPVLLPH